MSGWAAVSLPLRRRALPRIGSLDLWLTDLDELPLDAGPTGLTRKERILKQRIQQQFLLRLLLGSYLGRPGKDIVLSRSDRGKPLLTGALALSGLRFNLSHSGTWLAIVVAREMDVGVDIESRRPMRRPADMARRHFPAAEADWLASLEEPGLSEAFLTQWTAREALIKAAGSTLAESLGQLELTWHPTRIKSLPATWPSSDNWSLLRPDMPGDLIGHVAAPQGGVELERFFLSTNRS